MYKTIFSQDYWPIYNRAPCAHHDNAVGANEAYSYSYLFTYQIDLYGL